jgi:hypothetical protein
MSHSPKKKSRKSTKQRSRVRTNRSRRHSRVKRSRVKRSRVKRSRVKRYRVKRSRVKRSRVKRSRVKHSRGRKYRVGEGIGKLAKSPQYRAPYSGPLRHQDIWQALHRNDGETIYRLVMEKGLNPNESKYDDDTLVYYAASWGYDDALRGLASSGARMDQPCQRYGRTPLWNAAYMGKLDAVKFLHENCYCPLDTADNTEKTPLQIAEERNNEDVVEYIRNNIQNP